MTTKTNISLVRLLSVFVVLGMFGFGPLATEQAVAGEKVEFRLDDGTRFRGEIGDQVRLTVRERSRTRTLEGELREAADLYVIVRTEIAGRMHNKTIFKGDIESIETTASASDSPSGSKDKDGDRNRGADQQSNAGSEQSSGSDSGVYLLPLRGSVGTYINSRLIDQIAERADERGPGQTIILQMDTNGGLVIETREITEKIFELRKRHRVIAWIHKAISAGAAISIACQERYFMTEGVCGSVTTISGRTGLQGAELEASIEELAQLASRSGVSPHIARAMKANKEMCSYDKDPETGEVTFYGDLSGEYVLSDARSNLNFNASNALHCGFSNGTADDEEELARLLDRPKWKELDNQYGRKISRRWHKTVERAEEEIPRLGARYEYIGTGSGDPAVVIGKRIQIIEKLIRWWDRCFNCTLLQGVPPKEALEEEVKQLRHELAQIRRDRR